MAQPPSPVSQGLLLSTRLCEDTDGAHFEVEIYNREGERLKEAIRVKEVAINTFDEGQYYAPRTPGGPAYAFALVKNQKITIQGTQYETPLTTGQRPSLEVTLQKKSLLLMRCPNEPFYCAGTLSKTLEELSEETENLNSVEYKVQLDSQTVFTSQVALARLQPRLP